jgi:hypothetical protein
MDNKKKLLIFIVVILLLFVVTLPFLNNYCFQFFDKLLQYIKMEKDYYSSISYIVSINVGIFGLLLGFFYFHNRRKIDIDIKERELRSKRIEILINNIDEYDRLVHHILNKTVKDNLDLKKTRYDIHRIFEIIGSYLDLGYSLYGMTKINVRKIVKIYSFIDKSPLIMDITFNELARTSDKIFEAEKKEYQKLVKIARICCLTSICNKI